MIAVRVVIREYVDDSQPGWVECCLTDTSGKEWRFREKVPVVTDKPLGRDTTYPQPGVIACQVLDCREERPRDKVATIDTSAPWGIESVEGQTIFEVPYAELVEI